MVRGAGKTEDGLVRYNEKVNKLGDDLRELYETIRVNVDEEEQWKVFEVVEPINVKPIIFIETLSFVKESDKLALGEVYVPQLNVKPGNESYAG